MCDLVNQLLAVKAISDNDMKKLKSDKYLFYDPLVLMELRHKQVRKMPKRVAKSSQPKTSDIESSRILREEEQRKRVKMREVSIVNRKLDEFKREIELSKKRFEKHTKILDTSCSFKNKKTAVKSPFSVDNGKTVETAHYKALQSCTHSSLTIQMSHEKDDCYVQNCAIKKLEVHDTFYPDKTELVNIPEYVQANNCQTDNQENENLSEPSKYTIDFPCLLKRPSVTVKALDSIANMPKSRDSMISYKSVFKVGNCSTDTDKSSDEIFSCKCDLSLCNVTNIEHMCQSNIDIVGSRQAIVVQQENELLIISPGSSTHQEVKASIVNERNFSKQCDEKISNNDTMDFIKDTDEVNVAEIQRNESETCPKRDRTSEDQGGEQCTHFESVAEAALRNSSKKGLAGVFVNTLVRQNTPKNYKKNSVKGNKKKDTSSSVNERPGNNRHESQAEILHKYWLLWKDYTYSEKQNMKVDRLMSALKEFQKNDQHEQHLEERTGCHSAGPVLESQNLQNCREELSNMTCYHKGRNIRKPNRSQSTPVTSNFTSCQVSKTRGRERSRKQQGMINDIENKVRELSTERQKREAALSQEKEEMHIRPYGKVPVWVLQPTRLIASDSIQRAQERKEAIKLRLETKRLQQEQQAVAERMRLEAETERVRALHELVWTQYQRKVSRRLLLDPLRALVAESHQKQAQASAFASHLLLKKYWKAWRQITFEKMNAFVEVVCRVRMRRAFQAFLEIKANNKRQHQVAEDFYDIWILQRWAFIRWRSFIEEQLAREATLIQTALQHYNRTLIHHYFKQWYKVRDEKKRRERLEMWRIRVREVLPDFMPPETD